MQDERSTTEQETKTIIFHQNVDRIRNKIDRLNHFLNTANPEFVVITEHGLKHNAINNARLAGFTLVSAYSRTNHQKGGVAIYKNCNLQNTVESLNIEHHSEELVCEMSAVKMRINKKRDLYILGIYRPPSASLINALPLLDQVLDSLSMRSCDFICIVGDMNVDGLKQEDHDTVLFKEFLASHDINRLVLPPTRITPTSISSVDIVCTNTDCDMVKVDVIGTHISDHTGQLSFLEAPARFKPPQSAFCRLFSFRNLTNLKCILAEQTWEKVLLLTDAETSYSCFVNSLVAALDMTCPYTTSRVMARRFNKQTLTSPEVIRLKTLFSEAQNKYINSGQEEDRLDAAQKKKAYDLKLREIRRQENQNFIGEARNKSKALWQVINSERSTRKESKDIQWEINSSGKIVEDIQDVANIFNSYFATIVEDILQNNTSPKRSLLERPNVNQPEHPLQNFHPVSLKEVLKIIQDMKPTSSAGLDDISSKLLKFCAEELCLPIMDVVNKSLQQGVFPSKLKTSKVYPLYKQGDKKEVHNFRPISIIPTVSKIIEKAVLTRLMTHLQLNNLLPERQHGFISGKSTTSALVDLIEHITDNIEAGNTVTSLFLDLSKAFDSLDHNMILRKLDLLGIKGTVYNWFGDYLSGRNQIVEIRQIINRHTKTARSLPQPIQRGVPQGSVLGPVLFILFTQDLPTSIEAYSHAVMYADDTALITSSKTVEQLEIDTYISICMAQDYCLNNSLVFNEAKTKQLILGRHRDSVTGPPNIATVDSTKHLGMVIDNKLSWNHHVDTLSMKLSSALYVIKRIKSICNKEATRTAYCALFESHIRYGIILWGGSSNKNLERILVMQKRALRIMAGLHPRDSCRQVFKNFNILTVVAVYVIEVITHAFNQNLLRNGDIHNMQTRNANDYTLPAHRTALFEKKPSYTGAKLYNLIPANIKEGNPQSLKKRLQSWLLEEPIYSLEEFFTLTQTHH